MWIFSRYITKNGKRIYSKNGKCFRFWVDNEADNQPDSQLSFDVIEE